MVVRIMFERYCGFLGEETVSGNGGNSVDDEVVEGAVSAHMEDDQYRDDLRVRHAVGLVAVAFPVTYLECVFFHRLIEKTCRSRLPCSKFP